MVGRLIRCLSDPQLAFGSIRGGHLLDGGQGDPRARLMLGHGPHVVPSLDHQCWTLVLAAELVQEATEGGGIYIRFDSGLVETFPLLRFLEYFRPAVVATRERITGPTLDAPWIERTPSGRILLHRTGATRSGTAESVCRRRGDIGSPFSEERIDCFSFHGKEGSNSKFDCYLEQNLNTWTARRDPSPGAFFRSR